LEALTLSKQNTNLRRIDIRTWGSEVAKQWNVRRLPMLWLYNGKTRVATKTRDVLKRLSKLQ
jgi:hypothetical protein